jgi:2'-5' RNA ligase
VVALELTDTLKELRKSVIRHLMSCDIHPSRHFGFNPHVTLAKGPRGKDIPKIESPVFVGVQPHLTMKIGSKYARINAI